MWNYSFFLIGLKISGPLYLKTTVILLKVRGEVEQDLVDVFGRK